MDKKAEIKKKLQEVVGIKQNLPLTAEVVSVQSDTCTVKLASGINLSDVRLTATINEDENIFVLVPKIGSDVIVISQTGELSALMVIKVDKVEKLIYKQDGVEFIVDSTTKKITIKNEQVSVKELFQSLATIIKGIKVTTSTGPSGTPLPDTITAVQQFETKFNQLLD